MSSMESITKQLVDLGALKIILFGSLASGNIDVSSDLDLLVIMPSTQSGKQWMKDIYENTKRRIAADIIVYNQTEFEIERQHSHFLRNILDSGRVIYEKTL